MGNDMGTMAAAQRAPQAMSVAFRRDSDEEHLEPKFELPLPPGPNLVTARGLAMISAKVTELDAALLAATDDPARDVIKRDLRYWRARESTAQLAPIPDGTTVAFGTRVTFTLNDTTRTIAITGSDEANPATDHITFTAPLARAMMGLAVGDVADFGRRADAIEIIAIDQIVTA
jgi:transcription elongation GreA/GreB family factor